MFFTMSIVPETKIVRSETLLSNHLGKDVVMMDIEKGAYYGMEKVAARIWEMVENPVTVGNICENLTNEYEVSPEKCLADLTPFLDDLLSREIIEIVE
jgi:hypothetical protein